MRSLGVQLDLNKTLLWLPWGARQKDWVLFRTKILLEITIHPNPPTQSFCCKNRATYPICFNPIQQYVTKEEKKSPILKIPCLTITVNFYPRQIQAACANDCYCDFCFNNVQAFTFALRTASDKISLWPTCPQKASKQLSFSFILLISCLSVKSWFCSIARKPCKRMKTKKMHDRSLINII